MELTPSEQEQIFSLIELAHTVSSEKEFVDRVYPRFLDLIPHGHFACGTGNISERYVHQCINVSFPVDYLRQVISGDGYLISPVAAGWSAHRRPQFIAADWHAGNDPKSRRWQRAVRQFGLRNVAAHGMTDMQTALTSYFSIAGINGEWSARSEILFELVVPYLHLALNRVVAAKPVAPSEGAVGHEDTLTHREREVLQWMCIGKSSDEIGVLLGISSWTVKVHVKHILRKLRVSTRSHAVANAIRLGLVQL